jgi:hypothetical protein
VRAYGYNAATGEFGDMLIADFVASKIVNRT